MKNSGCLKQRLANDLDEVEAQKVRIVELNLNDQMQWFGVVSKNPFCPDIDVWPIRFQEPRGMPALEGDPIGDLTIGSARGGLCEIIEDGFTEFVVDLQRRPQGIIPFANRSDLMRTVGEAAGKTWGVLDFPSAPCQSITTVTEETTAEYTIAEIMSHAP